METPPPVRVPGGAGRLWLLPQRLMMLCQEMVDDLLVFVGGQIRANEDDGLVADFDGRCVAAEFGDWDDGDFECRLDHPVSVHHLGVHSSARMVPPLLWGARVDHRAGV